MDEGRMFCGVGNCMKFGGVKALQHHKEMPAITLSIYVSSNLMAKFTLPFPSSNVNTHLYNVGNAIGYIILWP
jgi:hypothetical protein